ncbi:MAG: thioredoxin family protein [Tissierellia bacterium]|nr:thioredoxin family protein [Tissierellia bacterium]
MVELDRKNFDEEVLNAKGYTFVDFWSEGCEPCKALMPKVHDLAEKYGDKIKFCALDIAKGRRVAISQKVLGLPTMLMYKDGEKVDEIGADDASIENIEDMIKKYYEQA